MPAYHRTDQADAILTEARPTELPPLATDPARGMMGATSLEQFGEEFAAAYQTRDAEAVADMYEDKAIFAMPDAGYPTAIGRAAIVERMSEIFATVLDIEWISDPPAMVVDTGDYAIVHQTSRTRATLADGTQHETEARATYVLHRGTDGNWRVVIDHASSV